MEKEEEEKRQITLPVPTIPRRVGGSWVITIPMAWFKSFEGFREMCQNAELILQKKGPDFIVEFKGINPGVNDEP